MHAAKLCGDDAVVDDIRRHEANQPSGCRRNLTGVHDTRIGIAAAGEIQFAAAVHKRIVVDIRRGGHEAVDVHARTAIEHHAILVDDHQVAVCGERSVDLTGRTAIDPIEGHRRTRRLLKLSNFVGGDVEAAPIDDGHVAGLVYRQGFTVHADGARTCRHCPVLRIRVRHTHEPGQQRHHG